jgi:hypothetical protein
MLGDTSSVKRVKVSNCDFDIISNFFEWVNVFQSEIVAREINKDCGYLDVEIVMTTEAEAYISFHRWTCFYGNRDGKTR